MLIFSRKNLNPRLLNGSPPGSIGATFPSGWINGNLYLKWLDHFIKCSGASIDHKVLLILDNHESHMTLQAWEMCRQNGVVVSLPPHCSHKCQPLDLAIFGPLKSAYYKRCGEWLKMNPGKRITQYEVYSTFGEAYCAIATIQKCVNGFRTAGIYPLNSAVFTDEDFQAAENLIPNSGSASSEVILPVQPEANDTPSADTATGRVKDAKESTERDLTAHSINLFDMEPATVANAFVTQSGENEMDILATAPTLPTLPDTSSVNVKESVSNPVNVHGVKPDKTTTKPERVSVTDISPLPAAAAAKETTRRKRCKRSEVFTASPMKVLLRPIPSDAGQILKKAKKVSDYADNLGKKLKSWTQEKENKEN